MANNPNTSGTAPQTAQDSVQVHNAPPAFTIERQGSSGAPLVYHLPQVRCGTCEHCGVIDPNLPGSMQYKLCPHYRGIGELACSYCPANRDPEDVVGHHVLNVTTHPDKPGKLVVCCDSYNCVKAHQERFNLAG